LYSLRLAAGLTQTHLARRAGLRVSTLGNYERGVCRPRRPALARLARVLGTELLASAG
jgi:transcriptional regulator with XRE-family HTH domain